MATKKVQSLPLTSDGALPACRTTVPMNLLGGTRPANLGKMKLRPFSLLTPTQSVKMLWVMCFRIHWGRGGLIRATGANGCQVYCYEVEERLEVALVTDDEGYDVR